MPQLMNIEQASTLLNAVVEQATGQQSLATISNVSDFVSVAQVLLQMGVDPVMNAISQVWRRTVFAVREYDNPLSTLRMTESAWGNATRKLSPIADEMVDDAAFDYPATYDAGQTPPTGDGLSIDPWTIHKQKQLQTNFYGSSVYMQHFSVFRNQLMVSFESPEQWLQFNQMCITERRNDRESFEEGKARLLQANLIAAILDENASDRVIHALTEYNTVTGITPALTAQTVMQAGNFEAFIRWLYARIRTVVGLMGARSEMFQTKIGTAKILRHSRPENLRVALYRPFMEMIRSMVLSNLFNADMMNLPTYEAIDYWQAIDTPDSIDLYAEYTDTAGAAKTSSSAVQQGDIIGIIHDRDAIGYAMLDAVSAVTPMNPKGLYWNEYYHARCATLMDNTEKAVVILLD